MKITFNTDYQAMASKASKAAAAVVFKQLEARFRQSFSAKAWNWPNVTTRQNGSVAGTTRNLIDSKDLERSFVGAEIDGLRATYTWGGAAAPYAVAVHEGAVLRNGTVLPARPWTSAVLGTEPVQGIAPYDYRKAFRDAWLQAYRR